MKARLEEFSAEAGHGSVVLEDGRVLPFDAERCPEGVPVVGSDVEIELGAGRRGLRVVRLAPAASGTKVLSGLLERWGEIPTVLCLGSDGQPQRLHFDRSAWRGDDRPSYAMTVVCSVRDVRYAVAPQGWMANAPIAVEPADVGEATRLLLGPLLSREHEHTFAPTPDAGVAVPLPRRPTAVPLLCDGGAALESGRLTSRCELCNQALGRPGYGTTVDGREVEVACDGCVMAGHVVFVRPTALQRDLARLCPGRSARELATLATGLAEAINRVPDVLEQRQERDWPICTCEHAPTQYVGHPANRASFAAFLSRAARAYDHGQLGRPADPGRLEPGVEPESWDEVCCFVCAACGARYFTDQFD